MYQGHIRGFGGLPGACTIWGAHSQNNELQLGAGPWKGPEAEASLAGQQIPLDPCTLPSFTGTELGLGDHCVLEPEGLDLISRPWSPPWWLPTSPQSRTWGRGVGGGVLTPSTQAQLCQPWLKALNFTKAALENQPTSLQKFPYTSVLCPGTERRVGCIGWSQTA